MSGDLVSLVANTLRETFGRDAKLPEFVGTDTSLFGQEGVLDSLGLVTLIVALEQAIEDTLGLSVTLADEKAMSQRHSPYRTVGTLADYAQRVIEGKV